MEILWYWPELPAMALNLVVAFLCGLALGIERELRDKAAGLRTIVLISVGSALYLMVGEMAARVGAGSAATPDPTRIGSEVVAGIGFLGAGSIIQSRGAVHGLTTAATIWVAAAVGLCCGAGMYSLALGTTVTVVLALVFLDPLADQFRSLIRRDTTRVSFQSPDGDLSVTRIELLLRDHGVGSHEYTASRTAEDQKVRWDIELRHRTSDQLRLLESLMTVPGVESRKDPSAL